MAANSKKKGSAIKPTWNEITGVMQIYGNTFESKKGESYVSWSVSLPIKSKDGDVVGNYYIRIRFAGDAEEPDTDGKHVIDISKAFFATDSYEKNKETVTNLVLVVTDCEVVQ